MTKNNLIRLLLTAILLLSLAVRLYRLDKVPNGFFFDEATISYQAYSLVKTGHDTWGKFLPLFSFKDYGEYILPIGIYGQSLFVLIGGLSVWWMRFPAALLGTILVMLSYWFGRTLRGQRVGLVAALFLSLMPLSIGWGRFVFEGNFGSVFFLCGAIFIFKSFKNEKLILPSLFFFGLSMLSYHIFLVTTPVFVFLIAIFFRKHFDFPKKTLILSFLIICFFLLWSALAVYSGSGRQRFRQASTLLTPEKVDILNHAVGYCLQTEPRFFCRIFNNKIFVIGFSYFENYVSHFNPSYLGFDGTYLRQNILPKSGLMGIVPTVLFFVGLCVIFAKLNRSGKLLLLLIAVYPLANSFTGIGEISRVAFAAPILCMVAAIGFIRVRLYSKKISTLVAIIFVGTSAIFLVNYFLIFPKTNAFYTDFGYNEVYSFVRNNHLKYEKFFISRNYSGSVPYISALFYLPVDPNIFKQGKVQRYEDNKGYFITRRIGNMIFYNDISREEIGKRDFVIATPEEMPYGIDSQFKIIDPTGKVLLMGVEGKKYVNVKI